MDDKIRNSVVLLKAMSNQNRLKILYILSEGEKSVGELQTYVGLSQSALSQHLATLRREKLVLTRRKARTIYYSICDASVNFVLACLSDIYSGQSKT